MMVILMILNTQLQKHDPNVYFNESDESDGELNNTRVNKNIMLCNTMESSDKDWWSMSFVPCSCLVSISGVKLGTRSFCRAVIHNISEGPLLQIPLYLKSAML